YPYTGGNRLFGDYQSLIAVGNSVYGSFAARGNVLIPADGIDTTDKIVPFFYSLTLPGDHLSSLAPSLGGTATGSASVDTSTSVLGSAQIMGAGLLGDTGPAFATLVQGPAAISPLVFTGWFALDGFESRSGLVSRSGSTSVGAKDGQGLSQQVH